MYSLLGGGIGEHRTLEWISVADRRARLRGSHTTVNDGPSGLEDGSTEIEEAAGYVLVKCKSIINRCTARVIEELTGP